MGLRLNEIFHSIQGEGIYAGCTAVFVRTQGCPVGCEWCDSRSTWPNGGTKFDPSDLAAIIRVMPTHEMVVVTGGEPLIHDLDGLLATLSFMGERVHLETSGAYPFKGGLRPHWVTLSPKAAAEWHVASDVLELANEIKFVVDDEFSIPEAKRIFEEAQDASLSLVTPILMPEGAPPTLESVERVLRLLETEFDRDWRFGPRLQYAYPSIAKREGKNNTKGTLVPITMNRGRGGSAI